MNILHRLIFLGLAVSTILFWLRFEETTTIFVRNNKNPGSTTITAIAAVQKNENDSIHAARNIVINNNNNMTIASLHIPKTAGKSFKKDLPFLTQNDETCLSALPYFNKKVEKVNYTIAIFRSPRAHILSQYMHCRYRDNQNGRSKRKREKWPALPESMTDGGGISKESHIRGLDTWLSHMLVSNLETMEDSFHCYTPWNLQSRMLTCNIKERNAAGAQILVNQKYPQSKEPPWDQVQTAVQSLDFAGLTEHFAESVCVTHWLHSRSMPDSCDCQKVEETLNVTHDRHNMPKVIELADLSDDMLKKMDDLSKVDGRLHTFAQELFRKKIQAVEEESGIRLLCTTAG